MIGVALTLMVWLALVIWGIRAAKAKNRSPHWMWFGLHPLGALVVAIVMVSIGPLKVCPHCSRKARETMRLCPFCTFDYNTGAAGAGGAAHAGAPRRPLEDRQYTGVGGWLLFLCVALTIISPLVNGFRILQDLSVWDQISHESSLANIVGAEVVFGTGIVIFGMIAGIRVWRLSPNGPTVAKRFFIAALAYQGLMILLAFGSDLPSYAADEIRGQITGQAFGSLVAVSIWWSYLNRSKRVADLFGPSDGLSDRSTTTTGRSIAIADSHPTVTTHEKDESATY